MSTEWKAVYHSIVRLQNEMEWAGKITEPGSLLMDRQYWRRYAERWRRVKNREDQRGITMQKLEWRLSWPLVRKKPGQISAVARIHRKYSYRLNGISVTEQRVERENVEFVLFDGRWQVLRITPELSEATVAAADTRLPSTPLLHPNVQTERDARKRAYDREAVREYADRHWDMPNAAYPHFDVDCTNFVSQCLYAGNGRMDYTRKRDSGWWYRHADDGWSYSWSVAHSLHWYLAHPNNPFRATRVTRADELDVGDVILYDWNGNGRYGHSVVVAALDKAGQPLVNAHTTNSRHRYWDYKDSYAWTESTQYRFYHMADFF